MTEIRKAVALAIQGAWTVECSDVQIEDDEAERMADAVLAVVQRREDLIESLLAEWDWRISREEAARIADRIVERRER